MWISKVVSLVLLLACLSVNIRFAEAQVTVSDLMGLGMPPALASKVLDSSNEFTRLIGKGAASTAGSDVFIGTEGNDRTLCISASGTCPINPDEADGAMIRFRGINDDTNKGYLQLIAGQDGLSSGEITFDVTDQSSSGVRVTRDGNSWWEFNTWGLTSYQDPANYGAFTQDGNDDQEVCLTAADAIGEHRSGNICLAGNEDGNAGKITVEAGDAVGGDVNLVVTHTNGLVRLINDTGEARLLADGSFSLTTTGVGIKLRSPDASCSLCTVNNSDVFSCVSTSC